VPLAPPHEGDVLATVRVRVRVSEPTLSLSLSLALTLTLSGLGRGVKAHLPRLSEQLLLLAADKHAHGVALPEHPRRHRSVGVDRARAQRLDTRGQHGYTWLQPGRSGLQPASRTISRRIGMRKRMAAARSRRDSMGERSLKALPFSQTAGHIIAPMWCRLITPCGCDPKMKRADASGKSSLRKRDSASGRPMIFRQTNDQIQ